MLGVDYDRKDCKLSARHLKIIFEKMKSVCHVVRGCDTTQTQNNGYKNTQQESTLSSSRRGENVDSMLLMLF